MSRSRPSIALFGAAIFASSFLVSLVQPMVGKDILPWCGGIPAVWLLCLAFYQLSLFAGYGYAHLLIGDTHHEPPAKGSGTTAGLHR